MFVRIGPTPCGTHDDFGMPLCFSFTRLEWRVRFELCSLPVDKGKGSGLSAYRQRQRRTRRRHQSGCIAYLTSRLLHSVAHEPIEKVRAAA